jgi:hypothetical protein
LRSAASSWRTIAAAVGPWIVHSFNVMPTRDLPLPVCTERYSAAFHFICLLATYIGRRQVAHQASRGHAPNHHSGGDMAQKLPFGSAYPSMRDMPSSRYS